MLRTIKPKNARSKRALDARAPQNTENAKRALLLRGSSSSTLISAVLTDLHSLKKPLTVRFGRRNAVVPFEDASGLEFFARKNDAAFVVVGSHSKKRPGNLVVARMFDYRVLDMFEFGVDPDSYRGIQMFAGKKAAVGMKPMLHFAGARWESDDRMRAVRGVWMDFFRGEEVDRVDVEGLQYVISFIAPDEGDAVHMRVNMISTKKSGGRLPRVEVQEMGPRIDFTIRRVREAREEDMREALRRPKGMKAKSRKNIDTDIIGDKVGRIHTGKQDLGKLQSRKMKGLKKKRDAEDMDDDDITMVDDEEEEQEQAPTKKARKA